VKTVAQFRQEIVDQVFPSGQPEGLDAAHAELFQEGLAEISKWVPCEQEINVNIVAFCKTNYRCGMTILRAPHGVIERVFTIVAKDYCAPIIYRQVDWPAPECFGRQIVGFVGQLAIGSSRLPLGFMEADPANDSKCGRAMAGIWAIHDGNIYIAPWLQSVESVVIEWRGIKTRWSDDDPILNEDQDYKKAVKTYFQFAHERDYGSMERAQEFHNAAIVRNPNATPGQFDLALADLMWACRERTKTRPTHECLPDHRYPRPTVTEWGLPPAPAEPLQVVHIGQFAGDDAAVAALGALARGLGPTVIIGSDFLQIDGPRLYYDGTVGAAFYGFMQPYIGHHGTGAQTNMLWPAVSTLDWDVALADWQAFFPLAKTYYDVCLGNIHLFVLDSDAREPDGIDEASAQAQWLRLKLGLSPAPWKVVMLANNPYSSVNSDPLLQWPFRSWGADMVLSSGATNYERLNVGGLTCIVNGLGGRIPLQPVVTPNAMSVAHYSAGFGVGGISATTKQLTYDLIVADGSTADTITLSK
jgi:tartrate-resistant acid phosphatase type 5